MSRHQILGMPIDRLAPDDFIRRMLEKAAAGYPGYVCVPNAHLCLLAHDDPEYAEIIERAAIVMPDSVVLQKLVARKYRLPMIDVMRGDELTLAICAAAARGGIPVALVGGKNESLLSRMSEVLINRFPDLNVAYAYSPPFRDLTCEEEATMLRRIRECGARIVFVGLGCPKQERWMARYTPHLDVMAIGVGAAFDLISGEVRPSANGMHRAGFEWLHRLIAEPRRLWRRYLIRAPRFLLLVANELI